MLKFIGFAKKNEKITNEFIYLFILKIILFYMTIFLNIKHIKKYNTQAY